MRRDLVLLREPIAEPARYYHAHRAIVVRRGLLLEQERRYLWHELVHADRGDEECLTGARIEHQVEVAAARWAMPRATLEWAIPKAWDWAELADLLMVPEEWVRFRWRTAYRSEQEHLSRVNRLAAEHP